MPLAVKYTLGTARKLPALPGGQCYINDTLCSAVKVFETNNDFDGSAGRKILLFDEQGKAIPEKVIAVFPKQQCVCFTNSGKQNYQFIFGSLLESEAGSMGNVATDNKAKGAGFDPRLSFTCNAIRFRIIRNNVVQDFKVVY